MRPDLGDRVAAGAELDSLVSGWLTLPELSQAIDVPLPTLRQWVRERRLVTVTHRPSGAPSVPADIVRDGSLVRGLASALTVLADAGFAPVEALGWLLRRDDVLEERPVELMAQGRDVAVRRRAMTLAL